MWVLIERSRENPKDSWIAGVFKEHRDALDYVEEFKDFENKFRSNPLQELREIPATDYPIILVWEGDDHIYVPRKELAKKLFDYNKVDDEDHQYSIYSIYHEDYRGLERGSDYTKMTDHHHVTNDEIKRLIQIGLISPSGYVGGDFVCDNCRKIAKGALSQTGYQPPRGWQIVHIDELYPVCSEKCHQELIESLSDTLL